MNNSVFSCKSATFENHTNSQIALIFEQADRIIHDLIRILRTFSIPVYPSYLQLEIADFGLDSLERFKLEYNQQLKERVIETSKLVIFISTTRSVESNDCIHLLKQSKNLNRTIISLIVENIQNYEELKSTVLGCIGRHFELFKDRVYEDGYDQYMWFGKSFQSFINYLKYTVVTATSVS